MMSSTNIEENENKQSVIRKFRYSFNSLSSLMKIMEYLVLAYPNPFLDINNISFSYFASYLKNLCNRIVEKNYLSQVKTFLEKFKTGRFLIMLDNNEGIHIILLPIVGLFINISKSFNIENYNNFLTKVANLSDLDLDPFFDIYDLLKAQNILNEQDEIILENYKEFIGKLSSMILRKSDRKMSVIYIFKIVGRMGKSY